MTDHPVRFRPDILSLGVYRQGKPPVPGGIKLSSNELPFETLPAVREALNEGHWHRYPDATATELRELLAPRFGVGPDEILVGAGSVALLAQWITAAAGPGDEVVYAWRSFEAYPGLVQVAGATSRRVPNTVDHRHDIPAMVEAITDNTRVVLVCSPNNPTSTVVTSAEFEYLMERVPSDRLVILDEAYAEFVDHPDAVDGSRYIGRYPNLVVLRTLSKAYGLAGFRVGYAVAPPHLIAPAMATAIPLSVSAPAQVAAVAALSHPDQVEERVATIRSRIARVREALGTLSSGIPIPYGNFVWLPTGDDTETVSQWFEEERVVARVFPGEGLRVSIAEEEGVDALLRIIDRVVHELPARAGATRLG